MTVTFRQSLWKPAVLLLPRTQLVHSTRRLDWAGKKTPRQRSLRHLHGHCVLCYTIEGLLFLLVILPVNKHVTDQSPDKQSDKKWLALAQLMLRFPHCTFTCMQMTREQESNHRFITFLQYFSFIAIQI